jgi:hypothetical protein
MIVDGEAVSHVWLFNREEPKEVPEWDTGAEPPYLNPSPYAGSFPDAKNVHEEDFRVFFKPSMTPPSAAIYYNSKLIAILEQGMQPAWSAFATRDSRVALVLHLPNGSGKEGGGEECREPR